MIGSSVATIYPDAATAKADLQSIFDGRDYERVMSLEAQMDDAGFFVYGGAEAARVLASMERGGPVR